MKKIKEAYGLSRTRDKKGKVVERHLLDYVLCIHQSVGGYHECFNC